jgi:amino acid transporter
MVDNASFVEEVAMQPVNDKGLKRNAISFVSNVVIGISSTAPAYSLASALGLIAGYAAFGAPAILIVAFIPMLFIAVAYYHLNRADPDCGTTFSWATRAMGPHAGWMGGWAIIVTDILVMPSLAAIAGQYSFELVGIDHPSALAITMVGTAWIAGMTAICYFGIELSARTQQLLLGAELAILMIFSAAALVEVYGVSPPTDSHHVLWSWLNPFSVGPFNNFVEAVLVAVFIYWGWDCGVSINEETEDSGTAPGRAAVVSTIVLVGVYVLVAIAAVAVAGPELLAKNSTDIFAPIGKSVLGSGYYKLLIVAVLTSASASTQTTILPTARTVLSMADAGALPKRFAEIDPRYLSPGLATLTMGAVSTVWYVGLTMISQNVLGDSILALGLGIAFYYAMTGFACVIYFRRELFSSTGKFFSIGVLPGLGGLIMAALFVKSCFDLARPDAGPTAIFGIGGPLVIGLGALLAGLILMAFAQLGLPKFFRRKPEVAVSLAAPSHAHDL